MVHLPRSRLADTENARPVAGLSGVKAGTSIDGLTECIIRRL